MTLKLGSDLVVPLEIVTEKLAFLGRTGSGKTYAAMKLAELMLGAGAQIVTLDPIGTWWGLRTAKLPVYIFGGRYGDLPCLEASAGAQIADVITDHQISAVVDLSELTDGEVCRFATAFAMRFYERQRARRQAVHLFLEEAEEFVPQNLGGRREQDLARMLHHFQRMWKLGRNFGIGGSLISQRPQELNKKALNQAGTVFVFQMTGPHERKALETWVREKSLDEDVQALLPKLKVGHPKVWSPTFLSCSKVVRILKKQSDDVSSTPKVLAGPETTRRLSPVDLERLEADMAASIERAKAADPQALQQQLRENDRELAQLRRQLERRPEPDPPEIREVPVLEPATIAQLEQLATRADGQIEQLSALEGQVGRDVGALRLAATELRETAHQKLMHAPRGDRRPAVVAVSRRSLAPSNGHPRGVERRILNALAELEQLRALTPGRALVALLAGYTNFRSKGFANGMGALRSAGFVTYPSGRTVALTDEGRAVAECPVAPRSSREVQERIIALLGRKCGQILRPLIDGYPRPVPRDDVAAHAGYTNRRSKGFANAVGRLRTLGFVDYPDGQSLVATPALFLEEVRS